MKNRNGFLTKTSFVIAALVIIIFLFKMETSFYVIILHPHSWITASCFRSQSESDWFFCEPNYLWVERKQIYRLQNKLNMMKMSDEIFFKSNWEVNFHCSHRMRIGKMGDGGKWVCDPFKLRDKNDCVVYSAGSNGEFSFEMEMKKLLPKCSIFTLDSKKYSCPKGLCTFHQIVLGNGSTLNSKTWKMLTTALGHSNRIIDIFKIDIEGAEYEFFTDMLNSNTSVKLLPRQILIEVHPAIVPEMHRLFEAFQRNHYVIFSREPNLISGPALFEYAFFRLNEAFFHSL